MSSKLTTNQLHEVLSALKGAGSALLFCHVSPDGDTLGSALALKIRLERMGKQAWVALDGSVPPRIAYLPGVDSLLTPGAPLPKADMAIAIDVASSDRMGRWKDAFEACPVTLQMDHHGTNNAYAGFNLIDGTAPATALVLYRVLRQMDLPLSQEEAVCLYTALSTDTGNFIYDSTNAESFRMMSDLMDAGLPLAEYGRRLFRQKEIPFVRLLGQVLPGLRLSQNGRVAGLCLTLRQLEEAGALPGHTDGLVDYAIDLEGVAAAYFIRETADDRLKASLRSLEPYHVDGVAASLGGGGHKLAAGVTLDMPMDQAVALLEAKLAAVLEAVP